MTCKDAPCFRQLNEQSMSNTQELCFFFPLYTWDLYRSTRQSEKVFARTYLQYVIYSGETGFLIYFLIYFKFYFLLYFYFLIYLFYLL